MVRLNKDGKKVDNRKVDVKNEAGTGAIYVKGSACGACGLFTPGEIDSPFGAWEGLCEKYKVGRMGKSAACDHIASSEDEVVEELKSNPDYPRIPPKRSNE